MRDKIYDAINYDVDFDFEIGNLTLMDISNFIKRTENREDVRVCEDYICAIPLTKANIDSLRRMVADEWAETNEEFNEVMDINTITGLEDFIRENVICGTDWQIYKDHFVSCVCTTADF